MEKTRFIQLKEADENAGQSIYFGQRLMCYIEQNNRANDMQHRAQPDMWTHTPVLICQLTYCFYRVLKARVANMGTRSPSLTS